jgi:acylphosphatase
MRGTYPVVSSQHSPGSDRPGHALTRTIVTLGGRVQGVGFRYAVLTIAARHAVAGTVRNLREGERLEIDVEGQADAVEAFLQDVLANPPRHGIVAHVDRRSVPPRHAAGFTEERTA